MNALLGVARALKHLPGQHDQRSHAGAQAGGKAKGAANVEWKKNFFGNWEAQVGSDKVSIRQPDPKQGRAGWETNLFRKGIRYVDRENYSAKYDSESVAKKRAEDFLGGSKDFITYQEALTSLREGKQ